MTAVDRLVVNGNSVIGSLRAFSSPVAQDVSFTWLNEDGTEETATYSNIAKSQSASGGGSPTLVAVASEHTGTFIADTDWDENPIYTRCHQYSKGQFAISSTTTSADAGAIEMRIMPFQVDQVTGGITLGTVGYGFQNANGTGKTYHAFGYCGNVGLAWGSADWGVDDTSRHGGCTWRVNDDNTVTQGVSTLDGEYATNNASGGMLSMYRLDDTVVCNIGNGAYLSTCTITEADAAVTAWAEPEQLDLNGFNAYVWRCISIEVGVGRAGVVSNYKGVAALDSDGYTGIVGTYQEASGQSGDGIGFELANGKQVYMAAVGMFVRLSEKGACEPCSVTLSGHYLGRPILIADLSDWTGGYAAKEEDTFYVLTEGTAMLAKIKINEPTANVFTVDMLGTIDLSSLSIYTLYKQDALVDVTGDDDKFIVISLRRVAGEPSHTVVYENPLKDS